MFGQQVSEVSLTYDPWIVVNVIKHLKYKLESCCVTKLSVHVCIYHKLLKKVLKTPHKPRLSVLLVMLFFKSKVSVYPDHTCCLGHCRLRVFNSAVPHAQCCADRSVVDVTVTRERYCASPHKVEHTVSY